MTGFRVEVAIDAPREVVWSALTVPAEIRQWFGWDHDGLDDEIRYIFVDHAEAFPLDRLALDNGQEIQVVPDGERTVLRAVMPGAADGPPATRYDAMAEGWRTFFEQLRFRLERRPLGQRRTVYLTGAATGAQLLALLDAAGPVEEWHDSRHQRIVVDRDGRLVAVAAEEPLASGIPSPASATVSGYGLDDGELAGLCRTWLDRWRSAVPDAAVTP